MKFSIGAAKNRYLNKTDTMNFWITPIFLCLFQLSNITTEGQAKKMSKEEKRQERINIDSLFIVHSLPIDVLTAKEFTYLALKDSVVKILENRNYICANPSSVKKLIVENMFAFLPNPATDIERYKETMDRVAKDRSYYFELMELAEPFLQNINLSSMSNDSGEVVIVVKRQNLPNVKKSRVWNFKYDETSSLGNLASLIVETLTNKKDN